MKSKRVSPEGWHPILFQGDLVRAILSGRKTQTRRIVKFPADFDGKDVYDNSPIGLKYTKADGTVWRLNSPYGFQGDKLWVKETFVDTPDGAVYKADHSEKDGTLVAPDGKTFILSVKWKPSIFMPFNLSRITLEVVSVGAERLQSISDEDALAEGMLPNQNSFLPTELINAYRDKWEHINGNDSWYANPWVWVITFKRIKP